MIPSCSGKSEGNTKSFESDDSEFVVLLFVKELEFEFELRVISDGVLTVAVAPKNSLFIIVDCVGKNAVREKLATERNAVHTRKEHNP